MKYERSFVEYFSKLPLFTAGDASRYLVKLGSSAEYSRLLLHNLVRSRRLFRIKKGFYTFSKDENVMGFAFRPFYYGMEYALTLRKVWTQQANPVIITTSKANTGVRDILLAKAVIHRINSRAFFGFEYLNYSGLFVPVSLPEKILLDFLYFEVNIDFTTQMTLVKDSNRVTLRSFASRLGNRYLRQVNRLLEESAKAR